MYLCICIPSFNFQENCKVETKDSHHPEQPINKVLWKNWTVCAFAQNLLYYGEFQMKLPSKQAEKQLKSTELKF